MRIIGLGWRPQVKNSLVVSLNLSFPFPDNIFNYTWSFCWSEFIFIICILMELVLFSYKKTACLVLMRGCAVHTHVCFHLSTDSSRAWTPPAWRSRQKLGPACLLLYSEAVPSCCHPLQTNQRQSPTFTRIRSWKRLWKTVDVTFFVCKVSTLKLMNSHLDAFMSWLKPNKWFWLLPRCFPVYCSVVHPRDAVIRGGKRLSFALQRTFQVQQSCLSPPVRLSERSVFLW